MRADLSHFLRTNDSFVTGYGMIWLGKLRSENLPFRDLPAIWNGCAQTPAMFCLPIIKTLQMLKTLRWFDWTGAASPQLSAQLTTRGRSCFDQSKPLRPNIAAARPKRKAALKWENDFCRSKKQSGHRHRKIDSQGTNSWNWSIVCCSNFAKTESH
jgi:hypothetical protein